MTAVALPALGHDYPPPPNLFVAKLPTWYL